MGLPRFSVKRPVAILMFFLAIVLLGTISLSRLPVELMPNIEHKKITIITRVRGGIPPEEVEERVTKPVEETMSLASHLEEISSKSEKGKSTVILKFTPGTDMDFAALEVRDRFSRIKNKLPREMERPVIARYEETDIYCLIAAITSSKYTTEALRQIVDEDIKERLLRIKGVANVDVYGGRERKILVEVDQDRLSASGVSMADVVNRINASNLAVLAGQVERDRERYLVRTTALFVTVQDIKNLSITKTSTGSVIRLKDIAEVRDFYLEPATFSRVGVQPNPVARDAVSIYIHKESAANTVKVVKDIKERLDRIQTTLDKDIKVEVISDQAGFIITAMQTVRTALLYGICLAVLVLFLFLRSLRSSAIVILSIPISVIATFGLLYLSRMNLNVMSLSGLALGIGMLVDNAIVVLENIFTKREKGLKIKEAAILGSEEMLRVIIASTITTIVVFFPIVFVTEEVKMLYGGLALTVIFALSVSLFVSITCVPALGSRLKERLKPGVKLPRLKNIYSKSLIFVLQRKYRFLLLVFVVFGMSLLLFHNLDKEYLGQSEQGKFTIFTRLDAGAKLNVTSGIVSNVEEALSGIPEIKSFTSRAEGWAARTYVDLMPFPKRRRSTGEIIKELRPKMDEIERKYRGGFIYFSEIQAPGLPEVAIDIYGYDYDKLNNLIAPLAQNVSSVPGLVDLRRTVEPGRPEYRFIIDKEKAAYFGLSTKDIADILHAKMRGLRATLYRTEGKEVEIVARLKEEYRKDFDDLKRLTLTTPDGEKILLTQVCKFRPELGPSEIFRKDKKRYIELSATSTKLSLSRAIKKLKVTLKNIKLPKDYHWEFGRDYMRQLRNQRQLMVALSLTLILVYMVLASFFESYYQPFIIMISIPLAYIGAIIALFISRKPVGIGAIMGAIMLGGIVVNNAIILIDRINLLRKQGLQKIDAIIDAGKDRLRPILITTTTTVLALLPMAINRSEAANLWSPLAITVIGGLILSTLLTLLMLPTMYIIFGELKKTK